MVGTREVGGGGERGDCGCLATEVKAVPGDEGAQRRGEAAWRICGCLARRADPSNGGEVGQGK